MMNKKAFMKYLEKECKIWQTAYPESKEILEKFKEKLKFEVKGYAIQ